jgi:GntR family transcriptional repressor for pyruvate dehydrogenase complex
MDARMAGKTKGRNGEERLVQMAAGRMRDMVLASKPHARIGSLREIARELEVGIVTIQQAARVLEHEGLLEVRRGAAGGYYSTQPNEDVLVRAMSAYLLFHKSFEHEPVEIMTLFDCDLMPSAALCQDEALRHELRALEKTIDMRETSEELVAFETAMHDILFRMVDRPMMELLAHVTMRHYTEHPSISFYQGAEGRAEWRRQRHRIIRAILECDEDLAWYEANRRRLYLKRRLKEQSKG